MLTIYQYGLVLSVDHFLLFRGKATRVILQSLSIRIDHCLIGGGVLNTGRPVPLKAVGQETP